MDKKIKANILFCAHELELLIFTNICNKRGKCMFEFNFLLNILEFNILPNLLSHHDIHGTYWLRHNISV